MKFWLISMIVLSASLIGAAQNDAQLSTLTGKVVDQAGAVIPETEIALTEPGGKSFRAVANDEGIYRLSVRAGTYALSARYPKHEGWEEFRIERYEVAATREILSLDIVLRVNEETTKRNGWPISADPVKPTDRPETLRYLLTGAVYDTNGAVIVGASVKAVAANGQEVTTKTDRDGIYVLKLPSGYYRLEAKANLFCPTSFDNYKIVDSTYRKMTLDFALEVQSSHVPCRNNGKR